MEIILASASPRRRQLLSLLTTAFLVEASSADETSSETDPRRLVCELARRKAMDVAKRHKNAVIIAADTVVYASGEILGKPKSEAEAENMIRRLADRTHSVHTGVCILRADTREMLTKAERTLVEFAAMSDDEIAMYLSAGDHMDKAGAYGIQGFASRFIRRIDGCFFNVMGLPVHLLYNMAKEMGIEL